MSIRHAAVWIDHHEAKIFHVDAEQPDQSVVLAPPAHILRHPKQKLDKAHPADAKHFYAELASGLGDVQSLLILGPANAKLEFASYVREHVPALAAKIVGVETVDHPSDAQIVAQARRFFHASDRMH